jgi:hypothetical protein
VIATVGDSAMQAASLAAHHDRNRPIPVARPDRLLSSSVCTEDPVSAFLERIERVREISDSSLWECALPFPADALIATALSGAIP